MTIEVQNQQRIKELETELSKTRESAAMIVHALNCAVQLTEALITYMPDQSPLHPSVATAKGALDDAMRAIHRRAREPIDD
jgi:hypothetical protein